MSDDRSEYGPPYDPSESEEDSADRYATRQAQAIVGADGDEFVEDAAQLIKNLLEDHSEAAADLRLAEQQTALGRRARCAQAMARYYAAGVELRRVSGGSNISAILSVFEAYGFGNAFYIAKGLDALCEGVVRTEPIAPSAALMRSLIYQVGRLWAEHTDEFPEGDCDPGAKHCSPESGSGPEFVYRVLRAAGWDVTRDEVLEHLYDAYQQFVAREWSKAFS